LLIVGEDLTMIKRWIIYLAALAAATFLTIPSWCQVPVSPTAVLAPRCQQPGAVLPSPFEHTAGALGLLDTAAKIQQSEDQANARRAAIQYLATVDWTRHPEAEKALLHALRCDPEEGVRLDAAMGLISQGFYTKATIAALTICLIGSDRDGNLPETSPRVKALARNVLAGCLDTKIHPQTLEDASPEPLPNSPSTPANSELATAETTSYEVWLARRSMNEIAAMARHALATSPNNEPTNSQLPADGNAGQPQVAVADEAAIGELMSLLRDSPNPCQRVWAVQKLARLDWPLDNAAVVAPLLTYARHDTAGSVRAQCVYCLAKHRIQNTAFDQLLEALKQDADVRVREAVADGLTRPSDGR
jgi:hypothetical protein